MYFHNTTTSTTFGMKLARPDMQLCNWRQNDYYGPHASELKNGSSQTLHYLQFYTMH